MVFLPYRQCFVCPKIDKKHIYKTAIKHVCFNISNLCWQWSSSWSNIFVCFDSYNTAHISGTAMWDWASNYVILKLILSIHSHVYSHVIWMVIWLQQNGYLHRNYVHAIYSFRVLLSLLTHAWALLVMLTFIVLYSYQSSGNDIHLQR